MSEFQVKRLQQNDRALFQQLIQLFAEVFETEDQHAPAAYLENLLNRPGFLVYIALSGEDIAGGLTAYELPMYDAARSEIYIYDIAVHPAHQRQGIGKQLLEALAHDAREMNVTEILVEAHEEDQHAIDFYRKAGGEAERVVHFNFSLQKNPSKV